MPMPSFRLRPSPLSALLIPVFAATFGCSGQLPNEGGSPDDNAPTNTPGTSGTGGNTKKPIDPANPSKTPPGTTPDSGMTTPPVGPPANQLDKSVGAIRPMRRLTALEYTNTIKDLFGSDIDHGVALPDDPVGESTYGIPTDFGGVERDRYESAATSVGALVSERLNKIAPCAAADRSCAETFIKTVGKRVFRRPVLDDEVTKLLTVVYDKVRAAPISLDHKGAMRSVITAMLQSPQFLYHWQLTGPATREGNLVRLNGWEIASRLSYLLWTSMPDDKLFAAAESGALNSAAGVESEARRLLEDKTRIKYIGTTIFGQWLHLSKLPVTEKDKTVFAEFTPNFRISLANEADHFVYKAFVEGGTWSALMTSRDALVNERLSKIYGITDAVKGNDFMEERVLPAERMGIFTRVPFLAVHALPQESSPPRRGKVLLERVLCRTILPPPPGLVITPPVIGANDQTREGYEKIAADPNCAGCHKPMHAVGFAFEGFDAVGKSRATEGNRPINASGEIELDGKTFAFKNAGEFITGLTTSAEAMNCVTEQFAKYAIGRAVVETDKTSMDAAAKAFRESKGAFRDLLVALVKSDMFRLRVPAAREVLE